MSQPLTTELDILEATIDKHIDVFKDFTKVVLQLEC